MRRVGGREGGWDGEWHITIEVFRDLGMAFAAVLVLIYVLMVGWFRSLMTPLVVMMAIPFSLVGILPAHGLMGAFFSATSMIGFMAGAGIVVRNSIILVDFIEQRVGEGLPLADAVVDAELRVRGIAGLRVCDASVFPDQITGNPNAAITMIAEKAADMILGRPLLPPATLPAENTL